MEHHHSRQPFRSADRVRHVHLQQETRTSSRQSGVHRRRILASCCVPGGDAW